MKLEKSVTDENFPVTGNHFQSILILSTKIFSEHY